MNIFDGAYKCTPKDLIKTEIKNTRENYTYYYSLILSNINIIPFYMFLF
jgi:hypothetical protein